MFLTMLPEEGKQGFNPQWWSTIYAPEHSSMVDSEVEAVDSLDYSTVVPQDQTPCDSGSEFETTLRLRSLWAGLGGSACTTNKRKAFSEREECVEQPLRKSRRCATASDAAILSLSPSHSALILQRLPIKYLLMMRQTCKYFVDSCRSIFSLDLGELGLEWDAQKIENLLLPCFGTPLTLENVRSSRSMRLRDLHGLVGSGALRLHSLTLGPNCHIGRIRAKRVAALATDGLLQRLDLGGSGCLRSAGAYSLADSLTCATRSLSSLQHLNLRACRIGVEGANAVARLLASEECGLLSLCLQDNTLGSQGATALARSLAGGGGARLRSLNLTLNHLRTEGAAVVAEAVAGCSALVSLNLSWNLIRSGAAEALAGVVTRGQVRTLDLGFNLLRCSGAGQLASGLSGCSTLRELSLRRNELAAEGATQLARALFSNTSLQALDLGLNGVGPAGARLLGSSLARNSTLRHLDLDWNALRQQGIAHLAPGLRANHGLTHLDLSCNKLLQDGALALAAALAGRLAERVGRETVREGPILQGLVLRGNGLGPWGLRALLPLLGKREGELDLSDNGLGDSGCMLLANEGRGLLLEVTALNLSGNSVSAEGLSAVTRALQRSTRLTELKLARNSITRLPTELVELPRLAALSVHDNPLREPPAHVLQGGYKAIAAYLRRGVALERRGRCQCCGLVLCVGQGRATAAEAGGSARGRGDAVEAGAGWGGETTGGPRVLVGLGEEQGRGEGGGRWWRGNEGEEVSDWPWEEEGRLVLATLPSDEEEGARMEGERMEGEERMGEERMEGEEGVRLHCADSEDGQGCV